MIFAGMPNMGERAYAYAKACGIIGKSFLGKRVSRLENVGRLSELDRLVFPATARNLPEKELLTDLEDRITGRAVDSIISIISCFARPPEFLSLLVRGYEYADVKNAVTASLEKDAEAPAHTDLGRFQTVRFDKWPDIRAMTEGTDFDFLLDKKGVLYNDPGSIAVQTVLDRRYYSALWKALFSLPAKERGATAKILSDEVSLRNAGWALRLRTYYWMSPDEVKLHLMYIPSKGGRAEPFPPVSGEPGSAGARAAGQGETVRTHIPGGAAAAGKGKKFRPRTSGTRSLADDALDSLDFPLDNYGAWGSWRWKEFLNPGDNYQWHADPRYFQNAASRYLFSLAKHYFRLDPFSLDTVFCFIKLKQYEEDILTSNAEGLTMGMSGRDVFSLLGVEA